MIPQMNPHPEEQSVVHSTFVIERRSPKLPEEVFAAFADTATKRRWFVEGENQEVEEFAMDFRVGGTERFRYRFKPGTPFQGVAGAFFEGADGPQIRESGWRILLERLATELTR